MYKVRFITCY